MHDCHPFFRLAALKGINNNIPDSTDSDSTNGEFWSKATIPFLNDYWPHDRNAQSDESTTLLLSLLLQSGHEFANFWSIIKPFVEPTIEQSARMKPFYQLNERLNESIQNCHDAFLDFLVSMKKADGQILDYPASPYREIMNLMHKIHPDIVRDRRFQWISSQL